MALNDCGKLLFVALIEELCTTSHDCIFNHTADTVVQTNLLDYVFDFSKL